MKQTKEFEGKNIDQAIDNACSALNLAKKNLKYDVISSGSSGIFGIVGVKKARIRVEIPAKKQESDEKNKNKMDSDDSNGVMSIVDEAFGEKKAPAKHKSPEKTKISGKKKIKPVKVQQAMKDTPSSESDICVTGEIAGKQDDDVNNENSNHGDAHNNIEPVLVTEPEPSIKKKSDNFYEKKNHDNTWDEGFPPLYKDEPVVDVSEASIAIGRKTLQKMVDLITDDATIISETNQDKLLLKIEGGNSGVLIGRRGQTLEAMQFLTDKIINKKSESRVRLKVDIEGYMETRKENLKSLAFKMANKAKKTGRPATINQMTAQDRRIVHLALKDDASVRTQSMGEGYYRRLVIFPKKTSYRKNNQNRKNR